MGQSLHTFSLGSNISGDQRRPGGHYMLVPQYTTASAAVNAREHREHELEKLPAGSACLGLEKCIS